MYLTSIDKFIPDYMCYSPGNSKLHAQNNEPHFASNHMSTCMIYRTLLAISSDTFHITEIKIKIETVQDIFKHNRSITWEDVTAEGQFVPKHLHTP
jgi:hypothetical protein